MVTAAWWLSDGHASIAEKNRSLVEVSPEREGRAETCCGQVCAILSMLLLQVTEALRVVLQARLLIGTACLVGGGRPSKRAALLAKCSHIPLGLPRTACLPHHQDSWLLVWLPGLGDSASGT